LTARLINRAETELGGHIEQISIAGDELQRKKAQRKKNISDIINKIVP
jgi:hypothetical protein